MWGSCAWGGMRLPRLWTDGGARHAAHRPRRGRAPRKRIGLSTPQCRRVQENAARIMVSRRPARTGFRSCSASWAPLRCARFVAAMARSSCGAASPDHYPAPYAILELWRRSKATLRPRPEDPASIIGLVEAIRRATSSASSSCGAPEVSREGQRLQGARVHVVGAGVMGGHRRVVRDARPDGDPAGPVARAPSAGDEARADSSSGACATSPCPDALDR